MISLLITNYNTWELTERCIRSVDNADSTKVIKEIIVVDDFSISEVPSYIHEHALIKIICNKSNLGYVKSVNKAFEAAKQPICLLLDSDAYLISDIALVLEIFEKQIHLGMLGFNLVDEYGKSTGRGGQEPDIWSLLLGQQIERSFRKLFPKRSKYISLYSCAIAVRKKAFEAIGGFDEGFDFLDADHDFSMKMNQSDWNINVCESIHIFHKGGGSPQLSSKRVIRFYKNRFLLLKKHQLINFITIIRYLIIIRVLFEFLYFSLKIRMIKDKKQEIINDKIYGRKEVLKLIWRTYE